MRNTFFTNCRRTILVSFLLANILFFVYLDGKSILAEDCDPTLRENPQCGGAACPDNEICTLMQISPDGEEPVTGYCVCKPLCDQATPSCGSGLCLKSDGTVDESKFCNYVTIDGMSACRCDFKEPCKETNNPQCTAAPCFVDGAEGVCALTDAGSQQICSCRPKCDGYSGSCGIGVCLKSDGTVAEDQICQYVLPSSSSGGYICKCETKPPEVTPDCKKEDGVCTGTCSEGRSCKELKEDITLTGGQVLTRGTCACQPSCMSVTGTENTCRYGFCDVAGELCRHEVVLVTGEDGNQTNKLVCTCVTPTPTPTPTPTLSPKCEDRQPGSCFNGECPAGQYCTVWSGNSCRCTPTPPPCSSITSSCSNGKCSDSSETCVSTTNTSSQPICGCLSCPSLCRPPLTGSSCASGEVEVQGTWASGVQTDASSKCCCSQFYCAVVIRDKECINAPSNNPNNCPSTHPESVVAPSPNPGVNCCCKPTPTPTPTPSSSPTPTDHCKCVSDFNSCTNLTLNGGDCSPDDKYVVELGPEGGRHRCCCPKNICRPDNVFSGTNYRQCAPAASNNTTNCPTQPDPTEGAEVILCREVKCCCVRRN